MILHKHHIIPRHMGGTDDPSNLAELTVEDHAEAHFELWKLHGRKEDLLAYKGLKKLISKQDILKELCSHKGINNPMYGKLGKNNPNYGKKRKEESKKRTSLSLKKYASNRNPIHEKKLRDSLYNEKTNKKRATSIAREWEITFPNGKKEIIRNISQWCSVNGFNKSTVSCAAKNGNSHKGHRFKKLRAS